MAAATETTAPGPRTARASGLAAATGPSGRRDVLGRFAPAVHEAEALELIDAEDLAQVAEELDAHDEAEPETGEPDDAEEADNPDADEPLEPEEDEPPDNTEALALQTPNIRRVQARLQEALRLGIQTGLVERHQDGTLVLAGQSRARRETSDCACGECTPWAQQHWWCVVCGSGPHAWQMTKPQY